MPHREDVFIDGVKARSVTTVLAIVRKPFLEFWRGKHGNAKCEQILRDSQEIGKQLHEAIDCYFRGETLPELDMNSARMFALLKGWTLQTAISPIEIEMDMQSHEYKYYGACDLIAELDGQLVVVDWKTSSMMDPLHGAQLAAYAQMYKEMTGKTVTAGIIVRVDKKEDAKKELEVRRYDNLDKYFDVFLHCLALDRFVNGKDK